MSPKTRSLQVLATKIFKVKNDVDANIMREVFEFTYGVKSVISLAPRIQEQVSEAVRCCSSLKKLKNWVSSRSQNKGPADSKKLTLLK